MNDRGGVTVLELLITVVIIGVLAAVLAPSLMNARDSARHRGAEIHAKNVYTASFAYLAEETGNTLVVGDCTDGYVAGNYSVDAPRGSAVVSCVVSDADGDGRPEVVIVTSAGRKIAQP
ncbi:MAG: type II secretion system protein [Trueperaceae bacterium]|nr:MAG: type II secretion system protein [Trueperaceae bacterium]